MTFVSVAVIVDNVCFHGRDETEHDTCLLPAQSQSHPQHTKTKPFDRPERLPRDGDIPISFHTIVLHELLYAVVYLTWNKYLPGFIRNQDTLGSITPHSVGMWVSIMLIIYGTESCLTPLTLKLVMTMGMHTEHSSVGMLSPLQP